MAAYPIGEKPFFNVALGKPETTYLVRPPFLLYDSTAVVFALPANMDILSSFCQRYLNVAPKKIAMFRPYLPYVFLAILDYGHGIDQVANQGWLAQHEVFFAVPLEKWRRRRDRMVFEGWVLNAPYIFVGNPAAVTTGREVYGWPKQMASLRPSLQEWTSDPRKPIQFLDVSVEGYGDRDAQKVPLLRVDQQLNQNPSFAPADLGALNPFNTLSRLTGNLWQAAVTLANLLVRGPFAGFGPWSPRLENPADVLSTDLRQLFKFLRAPALDIVTLKQFRDSNRPEDICYQALVRSRMTLERFNHGGPLGLCNLLQGDPTGGFRIRIYDHPSLPIASSLGLQAVEEWTENGCTVSVVEPILPFWMNVDLNYGRGENLGWRMYGSPWYGKENQVVKSANSANYQFNTVAGAGQQDWVTPYNSPKAYCEVYPLRVYARRKLDRFIDEYLNKTGEGFFFRRLGSYVYMVVSRSRFFSQARSAMMNQIAFYVPLLWYDDSGCLRGIVNVKPYAFLDDPTDGITMREVQGVPAIDATIDTPVQSWLRQGPVLRMKTNVFSVLDAGMNSEKQTLIEVAPSPAPSAWSSKSSSGGGSKAFGGPFKMPMVTLKQFPDARDPYLACYQALIMEPWTMFWTPPRPLAPGTQICFYRYPNFPLAKTLGLIDPKQPPTMASGKLKKKVMVDVLTPEAPFQINLDIKVKRAQVVSRTAGDLPWVPASGQKERERRAEWEAAMAALNDGPGSLIKALLAGATHTRKKGSGGGECL